MYQDDCIEINDLIIFANHGVLPEEKAMGQKFALSLRLYMDMAHAAKTDDINTSVNYADVCSFVTDFTKKNRSKLIEAAADNIAVALLLRYPSVKRIEVILKKPWAPIGLPLEGVSVSISRSRSCVYIGIGSNLGDKKAYLDFAVKELDEHDKCRVVKTSDYIVTKPVGDVMQDDFLNACIELETILSPRELLDFLHEIENKAGRERKIHWGPRTLDLDILFYDDIIMNEPDLIIPHPEAAKREFVLKPLSEIAPYLYHPVKKDYIINLLERIKNNDNTRLL